MNLGPQNDLDVGFGPFPIRYNFQDGLTRVLAMMMSLALRVPKKGRWDFCGGGKTSHKKLRQKILADIKRLWGGQTIAAVGIDNGRFLASRFRSTPPTSIHSLTTSPRYHKETARKRGLTDSMPTIQINYCYTEHTNATRTPDEDCKRRWGDIWIR